MSGYVLDIDGLPDDWPVNKISDEFLRELGATIATFGALEEVLRKTIFALTGTKRFGTDEEVDVDEWAKLLGGVLRDALKRKINCLENVLREDPDPTLSDWPTLIEEMRKANKYRDILCHGAWTTGQSDGSWHPLFINTNDEIFAEDFDPDKLRELRRSVVTLIANCVKLVTLKGHQFPGGVGPGTPIW